MFRKLTVMEMKMVHSLLYVAASCETKHIPLIHACSVESDFL